MRKYHVRSLLGRTSEDMHVVDLHEAFSHADHDGSQGVGLKQADCRVQTKLEILEFVDAACDSL